MAESLLPAAVAVLKADISDFESKMKKATSQFDSVAQKKGGFEALATVGKAAFLGLSAAAVGFGAEALKVGVEQEAANARLTTALHNTGSAMTALSKPIEEAETRMRNLGFSNEDTTDSLAKLTNATKSPTKALQDESLAANVARGRHIDLATATDLLVKVETGHVALLGRIGINTKDATGATISQQEALKRLSDLYGGQASAYAGTFAGKMAVLRAEVGNVEEKIGMALIPRVEQLASATSHTVDWMTKHEAVAKALGVIVGGPLVIAMGAYVATQAKSVALTAAQVAGKLPQFFLSVGAALRDTTAASVVMNESTAATQGTMLLGAGAVGVFASAVALGINQMRNWDAEAAAWAHNTTVAAGSPAAALAAQKQKLVELQEEYKHLGASDYIQIPGVLESGFTKVKDKIEKTKHEISALNVALAAQRSQADQTSDSLINQAKAADDDATAQAELKKGLDSLRTDTMGLVNAQKSMRDSQENVAAATQSVADAQAKLSTLLHTSAVDVKAVATAQRDLQSAEQGAADAQDRLTQARKAFDTLVAGPTVRDQADANLKLAQSTDDIQRAQNNLSDKQKALSDLQKSGKATGEELQNAQLDLNDAGRQVIQAQETQADSQKALNDLMAAGTPDSQQYKDAQKAIADAQHAVDTANQQVTDSQDKLATAQKGDLTLSHQIADAKQAVASANKQAADAQDALGQSAVALYDAQQKENDTLANGKEAAGALRVELQNLLDLSPSLASNPFITALMASVGYTSFAQDQANKYAAINAGSAHAAGGPVSAGMLYPINDSASHNVEGFMPNQGGMIVPLGPGPTAGVGSVTIVTPVMIDGREVARATATYSQAELLRMQRRNVTTGIA